jgi:hypothetical protein
MNGPAWIQHSPKLCYKEDELWVLSIKSHDLCSTTVHSTLQPTSCLTLVMKTTVFIEELAFSKPRPFRHQYLGATDESTTIDN